MLLQNDIALHTFHVFGPSTSRHAGTPAGHVSCAATAAAAAPPAASFSAAVLATMLDQIEHGVMVCDHDSQILFANSEAQAELRTGRSLRRQGKLLRHAASNGIDDNRLQNAVRAAALEGKRKLIALQSHDDRLLLSVMPLSQEAALPAHALILMGRHERQTRARLRERRAMYGYQLSSSNRLTSVIFPVNRDHSAFSRQNRQDRARTQLG